MPHNQIKRPPVVNSRKGKNRKFPAALFYVWAAVFAVVAVIFLCVDLRGPKKNNRIDKDVADMRRGDPVSVTPAPVHDSPYSAEPKREVTVRFNGNHGIGTSQPEKLIADADSDAEAIPLDVFSAADSGDTKKKSVEPDIFKQLRNSKSKKISPEVKKLAEDITVNCTNDMQKARAIYNWLTTNIKYDLDEWRNIVSGADSYEHDHSPKAVLERGTTVCIGYSWLFDDMCASVGLESTYLIGDVRGYRGTEDDDLVSKIKHAWSAVKIDGEWGLLDATWGAVQDGETKEEAKGRADYYFLTPPSQLIFDHLPEDDEWQLLSEKIPTEKAFSILPNIKPSFFQHDLKFGSGYTSNLKAVPDKNGRLLLTAPDGVEIMATVCSESEPLKSFEVPVFRNGEAVAVGVPGQASGAKTILRIYSRRGERQPYSCSADFLIISAE